MASRLWYVKLCLYIGLPMMLIGITLFGATLYIRRHVKSSRMLDGRYDLRSRREVYTAIDLDIPVYLKRAPADIMNYDPMIGNDELRINIARSKILEGRRQLKQLSYNQHKYNHVIAENDINTHSIVKGEIIYTSRVINDYPDLHAHLLKLHKIQNTMQYYRKYLVNNFDVPFKYEMIKYRILIDTTMNDLIANTRHLRANAKSKQLLSRTDPVYDYNLKKFRGKRNPETGIRATPTDAEYRKLLEQDDQSLLVRRLRDEQTLYDAERLFNLHELKQLDSLSNTFEK